MIKINKIEYDNILSYDEFMKKYKQDLLNQYKKGEISQEIINNLISMIIEYDDYIKENCIEIVKQIYIAIIESKYMEYPNGYKESMYKLVRYISYLNFKKKELDDYIDLDEICNKAYNELLYNGIDSKYMKKEMEEEFKSIHILDIDYQLDNLKKYTTNKEFIDELDRKDWRII